MTDMLLGYSGLAVAFVILSAISLWILFSIKGKVILKAILTVAVIWYSVGLLFSVQNLSGWPTTTTLDNMRENELVVLAIQVKPTSKKDLTDKGAMYFWTVPYGKKEVKFSIADILNPAKVFDYKYKKEPRAYKIPYDKELHRELLEKAKKKKGMRGSFMILKKKKKGWFERKKGRKLKDEAHNKFKIINPFEIMKK